LLKSKPALAIPELRALANINSPLAAFHLGNLHEHGVHLEKDWDEAEKWYRSSGDLGLMEARYFLGRLYVKQKRYDEALGEFRNAAARGYGPALHYLGRMYFFGVGVTADRSKSQGYLERASAKRHILARVLLVRLLRESSEPSKQLRGRLLYAATAVEMFWVLFWKGKDNDRFW
jgi:TPR repeat protein